MKRSWKNLEGTFAVEIQLLANLETGGHHVQDIDGFRELPADLVSYFVGTNDLELVITFLSSGYYDPGIYSGPMDGSYPAEGDDERVLDSVVIGDRELPKDLAEKIFDLYQEEIDAVEIEPPEYERSDDDYM